MIRAIVIAALAKCMLFSLVSVASAAGGIYCQSKDKGAEISIGMGRVPIYVPFNAWVRHGEKIWMDTPQEGETQLGSSQGLMRENTLTVDFVDDQASDIIISLYVDYSGEEDDEDGYKGTLSFLTGESYTVYCLFE